MTSLRNIPVSDSSVYREIYQRSQERPMLGNVTHTAEGEENSKWAFLKKLLEIEEAHDKRRRARERQERAIKQTTQNQNNAPQKVQAATNSIQADSSEKWLNGQVFTEKEPDGENAKLDQQYPSSDRLPPVFGNMTPNTSRFSPGHNHNHPLRASSKSSIENSLFATIDATIDSNNNRSDFSNCHEHVSLRDLESGSQKNVWDLPSRDRAPRDEHHTRLSPFQRMSSRLTSAPQKRRQLRLPPILLPRVYTVQPRPLKALEFPAPTTLPGPITEAQWEDLFDCRYIRHTTPRASLNL
ncbi:HSPB1-associated protein 1 [Elysia marginata]|uniref:HSPB1-associated protein 1 n=1 Tax=Elysia marginata TaxID=1093978 RepID=A0AAV4H807_9GAST|nr:HSPB1-associated protein 1 [Elysia marginata]